MIRFADDTTDPVRQEWRAYLEAGMPDETLFRWYRISVRLAEIDRQHGKIEAERCF